MMGWFRWSVCQVYLVHHREPQSKGFNCNDYFNCLLVSRLLQPQCNPKASIRDAFEFQHVTISCSIKSYVTIFKNESYKIPQNNKRRVRVWYSWNASHASQKLYSLEESLRLFFESYRWCNLFHLERFLLEHSTWSRTFSVEGERCHMPRQYRGNPLLLSRVCETKRNGTFDWTEYWNVIFSETER
jgi:hypothetical protein